MVGFVAWRHYGRGVALQHSLRVCGHKAGNDVPLGRIHLLLRLDRCWSCASRQQVVAAQLPAPATCSCVQCRLHTWLAAYNGKVG